MSHPMLSVLLMLPAGFTTLKETLRKLEFQVTALAVSYDIHVIDVSMPANTSSRSNEDETAARTATNGYGTALRTALRVVSGSYALTVEPQHLADQEAIARLWAHRDRCGLVIGSRYVDGGEAHLPFLRRALSRVGNQFLKWLLSLKINDFTCGLRLYNRAAVMETVLQADHVDVLVESAVCINAEGWPIQEVAFRYAAQSGNPWLVDQFRVGRALISTFARMWVLRNSPFSADYDERAFNSWIPLQRYWQRARHRYLVELMGAAAAARVLDIGCGSSRVIRGLDRSIGLDIQLKKVRKTKPHVSAVVQGSLARLPFKSESLDVVVCSQVIEHVPHEVVDWHEIWRVLRTMRPSRGMSSSGRTGSSTRRDMSVSTSITTRLVA